MQDGQAQGPDHFGLYKLSKRQAGHIFKDHLQQDVASARVLKAQARLLEQLHRPIQLVLAFQHLHQRGQAAAL